MTSELTNLMNTEAIYQDALSGLEKAETLEEIENLSVKYLGRKGQVTVYLRGVSALPPEERPSIAQVARAYRMHGKQTPPANPT